MDTTRPSWEVREPTSHILEPGHVKEAGHKACSIPTILEADQRFIMRDGIRIVADIFRPKDAPNYVPASIISACFGFVAALITVGVGLYMKLDNRKRNKQQGVSLKSGDVPTSSLKRPYQKDPNWRWMGGMAWQ